MAGTCQEYSFIFASCHPLIEKIQETCSLDFTKILYTCMLLPVFLLYTLKVPFKTTSSHISKPEYTSTHPLPHNTIIILHFPLHVKIEPEVTE